MKRLRVKNYNELASLMHESASAGDDVYAIVFYDDAMELLRKLVTFEDVEPVCIDASAPVYSGYCKEYFVSLSPDMELFIDPAWHEENDYWPAGYLDYDADCIYIDGDASFALMHDKSLDAATEIVWAIKDRDDHNADCSLCAIEDGIELLLSGMADLGYTEQNCALLANALKAIDSLIEE